MNRFSLQVPPGFRFHPTDEELVDYYLRKKVASRRIDPDIIKDVDLYKIEPWDLQELCKMEGGSDEQNDEWYFFSHKDKKYPTGSRTNRATKAGFWKATGRDKAIYSKQQCLIGMRKTLVFYKGRAPNGHKSDWIMHEYRLETNQNAIPREEGWVVCRVFKKRMPTMRKMGDYAESPSCWYEELQVSYIQDLESPNPISNNTYASYQHNNNFPCKQEFMELQYNTFLQLPQLESPKVPQNSSSITNNVPYAAFDSNNNVEQVSHRLRQNGDLQVMDWRVLDKFVASQLMSHHENNDDPDLVNSNNSKEIYSDVADQQIALLANGIFGQDFAASSTSTSSTCHIDLLWNK